MTSSDFAEITKSTPERRLTSALRKTGGRNVYGRITARRRGGGHKRRYRQIDFRRNKFGVPAQVAAIEYDPNRSARIALLHYLDGEKAYILAPKGLKVGATVEEQSHQLARRALRCRHQRRGAVRGGGVHVGLRVEQRAREALGRVCTRQH